MEEEEEEEELVTFAIIWCASIGYGKTRKDVSLLAQRILDAQGKQVSLSAGWWNSLSCRRHPNITLCTPAILSCARSKATCDVIESYFELLGETLHENDLLDKPGQIFNMDESGMPLDPKLPKTVHMKGESTHQVSVLVTKHRSLWLGVQRMLLANAFHQWLYGTEKLCLLV